LGSLDLYDVNLSPARLRQLAGWWIVTCNGIPLMHFGPTNRDLVDRTPPIPSTGRDASSARSTRMPSDDGWHRLFDKPIELPGGGELRTLLDAGRYIAALPRATQERREWRIATEILLRVAEGRWPIAFADIAIRRALNNGKPPPRPPDRRDPVKKFKIIR